MSGSMARCTVSSRSMRPGKERASPRSGQPSPAPVLKSKYGVGRISRVLLDLLIVYFIDRAFDRPIQFFGKPGLGFIVLAVAIFGWGLALNTPGTSR